MENPYRGFAPVCICGLSIAPRFRNCKRGQRNFLHFGRLDNFFRGNWAKWRKIGGIFLCLFLFASDGGLSFLLYFCLRRVTFFLWRKKVTKERHLRGEGFRFPSPLKNPLTLKRPNGEGLLPLPFGKPHPGVSDYQIAPLPRSGKGRWRPMAAVGEKEVAFENRLSLFGNTLRGWGRGNGLPRPV